MNTKAAQAKQSLRGALIRDARGILGLSRNDVAGTLDIAPRALAEIERGDCTVRRLHGIALECLLRRAGKADTADKFRKKFEETE